MNNKIKVLHYVSLMNRAGQETFIMNVYRTIDRNKFDFDFLCCLDGVGDYDEEIKSLGGTIHHLPLLRWKSKLKQIENFWVLFKFLWEHHNEYKVFHIHTQHAMDAYRDVLAAKMAGIKTVVVHSHSTSTLHHKRAHYLFQKPLNRMKVVCLACSDLAGKWLYGDDGEFEVVNNGIMIEHYKFDPVIREQTRKENGWEGKFVIGHVGSFTYPKNHAFIIKVFKEVLHKNPGAILAFAGKGELEKNIRDLVSSENIKQNVVFLGTRSDINYLDQAFDVLLFPSHYEGLPVVLVEAQATGLKCIISDVITEQVDVTNRIVRCNLEDPAGKWADIVLKEDNYPRELAYTDVSNSGFNIENTVRELEQIYS